MANPYFTPSGSPATSSTAASSTMRNEFNAIEDGFDKLATLSGNSELPVFINTGETGQEAVSIATALTRLGLPANLATLTLPASVTISAFGATIIDDADAVAVRTTLGLVIGTNVQAYDAFLGSISALGTAADKMVYTTGVDTAAEAALTAFARTILDDADAAAVRTTIGAGDVSAAANLTDEALVVGDGEAKGVKALALGDALAIPRINAGGTAIEFGTGGQLAFPATAVPSADPNTLDDYEEGTYTATLTCGISGTITLNTSYDQLGYTKIGRVITVIGDILVASVSSPVGNLTVLLPYAIGALTESADMFIGAVQYGGLVALSTAGLLSIISGGSGNPFGSVYEATTTGNLADVANHMQAGSELRFGFSYFV